MAVKYGYPTRTPEFRVEFERYARMTGPAGRVALCHAPDGTLIGFCLYYVWGDAVYLRWASFDYDRLVGCEEYFNLVYYSQIRLAGELGVRWVHAGKKALEAKVLRGAELRPLWMLDLSPGRPPGAGLRSRTAAQRPAARGTRSRPRHPAGRQEPCGMGPVHLMPSGTPLYRGVPDAGRGM